MNDMTEVYYYRSPVVLLLKKVDGAGKAVLPPKYYIRLHDGGFWLYRQALRALYGGKLIVLFLTGGKGASLRSMTVLKVMPFSLVGSSGLEASYDVVQDVSKRGLEGSLVECGVAEGGSAALMALAAGQSGARRTMWLFDSFEGLPDPTEEDYVDGLTGSHARELPRGSCCGTKDRVEKVLFGKFRLDPERTFLVAGWFEDTLPHCVERVGPIAVLRIDADWYQSVRCCLENFYQNVVPTGYVVIDDYATCFGAKRAVDEFVAKHGVQTQLVPDGRGGCYFVKPG